MRILKWNRCDYHYLAVLRIEKIVQSEISDHTLEVDVICIHYMQNIINVTMNSSEYKQHVHAFYYLN
jgi:hypothetical protein